MKIFDILFSIWMLHFDKRQDRLWQVQGFKKAAWKKWLKFSKQYLLIDFRLQMGFGILGTSWRCWMLIISFDGLWQYAFISALDCSFWDFHPRALFFFFFLFSWLFHHALENSKFIQNRWLIQKDNCGKGKRVQPYWL